MCIACFHLSPNHFPDVGPTHLSQLLQKPKGKEKDYDESDQEFLKKKKEEEAALKKAREALLKGKKK